MKNRSALKTRTSFAFTTGTFLSLVPKTNINVKWLCASMFAVSLFFRFFHLSTIQTLIFDEAHYVPAAQVLAGVKPHPGVGAWSHVEVFAKSPDPNFYHPPLGKFLMSIGIRIFGDNSLGWRASSAAAGLAIVGLTYLIAVLLLQNTQLALATAALLSLDFLQVVQSRVGMLDIFLALFVTAAVYGSLRMIAEKQTRKWAFATAFICAGAMSIKTIGALTAVTAIALTWTSPTLKTARKRQLSLIIGLGTAVVFCGWAIYYAQYGYSFGKWINLLLESNSSIMKPLKAHPYGSNAADWLFNFRVIWYHFENNPVRTIVGMGNPAIWLAFLPCSYVLFAHYWKERQPKDLMLMLIFAINYIPFHLVLWKRQGFIYYMLPATVSMALINIRALSVLKTKRPLVFGYLIAALVAFAALVPILIAMPLNPKYYGWLVNLLAV